MSWDVKSGRFALGALDLQSGETLRNSELSWKSFGTLAPARDNVIVYPTSYSAQHTDLEWLIGPDEVLDPTRWFIVIPDMFGNGLSSSPSTVANYPALVTTADNVHAQHRLLREVFGVEHVACVYGFSMGAQQAYHWAALYPGTSSMLPSSCAAARAPPCTTRCSCARCWRRWKPRPSIAAAAASPLFPKPRCGRSRASTPAGR